jgi:hypothetical protein
LPLKCRHLLSECFKEVIMSAHQAHESHEVDAVEAIVPHMPVVLPVAGAVLIFLLAFIAVFMA